MKAIYTLLVLLIPFIGFGQGWTLILDHPYANSNERPYSFVEDDDGYLFVCTKQAYNIDTQYDTDIWLVKVGFNGDTILTKSLDFSLEDVAYSIIKTNDNGYAIGATIISDVDGGNWDNKKFCLIKLNSNLEVIWTNIYSENIQINENCHSIIQTSDGGYILTGNTSIEIGFNNISILLIKTDINGDKIWSKIHYLENLISGIYVDVPNGYDVKEISDGFILLFTQQGGNYTRSGLYKLNFEGDTLWTKSFDFHLNTITDNLIVVNDDFILAGEKFNPPTADNELYYCKLNNNGELIWDNYHFNGMSGYMSSNTAGGNFLLIAGSKTNDNGLIFCSNDKTDTYGYAWNLLKTDFSGNIIFSEQLTLPIHTRSNPMIKETNDGGFLIFGTGVDNYIDDDVLIIKTNQNGITSSTTQILEKKIQKNIFKYVNLLGQEIQPQKNQLFIEIYDDGSLEKKVIIE